jgi:hypothetical protein
MWLSFLFDHFCFFLCLFVGVNLIKLVVARNINLIALFIYYIINFPVNLFMFYLFVVSCRFASGRIDNIHFEKNKININKIISNKSKLVSL